MTLLAQADILDPSSEGFGASSAVGTRRAPVSSASAGAIHYPYPNPIPIPDRGVVHPMKTGVVDYPSRPAVADLVSFGKHTANRNRVSVCVGGVSGSADRSNREGTDAG